MQGSGTREQLGAWLRTEKHMTYTTYSKLDTKTKLALQEEYQGRRKKKEAA